MKTLFKIFGGGSIAIAALAFVLGNDLVPWVATAKQSAKDQLVALVDQHELKINQSRQKIREFETAVVEQAKRQARLETTLVRLGRNIDQAESIKRLNRDRLRSMQTRLSESGQVFTAGGQAMTSSEIQRVVADCGTKLELASSRVGSLQKLRDACTSQLEKLRIANAEAPQRIRSLRSHCEMLETKIRLAKEMSELADSTQPLLGEHPVSPQDITDSLYAIDAEIDAEIAGVTTLLSIQDGTVPVDLPTSTDSLVQQIDSYLGGSDSQDDLAMDLFE